MKDKVFIDTNVWVYSSLEDEKNKDKREKSIQLLERLDEKIIISLQVIHEFSSALLKNGITDTEIQEKIDAILEDSIIANTTIETVKYAWKIKSKYRYSYWDSLIIASALESECNTLYSEDMQDKQVIEQSLIIINPFLDICKN